MYSFLRGKIALKQLNSPFGTYIVLEVNNIGYSVMVNYKTLQKLPVEGTDVTLFTQLIHKEDNMYLCGFTSSQERDLFNFLQSVSGVGVKVALNILAELDPLEVISSLIKEDYKALSRPKGIGPKIAQRIILELKDKMVNWRPELEKKPELKTEIMQLESYVEAESVLLSLGYRPEEIQESLKVGMETVKDKNDTEELLQNALKWLSI